MFMRRIVGAAALLILTAGLVQGDDAADKTAARKKAAEAAWTAAEAGEFSHLETTHLLIYAPKDWQNRLKDLGTLLEKYYEKATAALSSPGKKETLPAKATVFIFADREHFGAFVRRVEKRRLEPDDTASYDATDEALHVAVGPSQSKTDLNTEGQAGEQLAELLLARKAGIKTILPGWLVDGFGRATSYHAVGGPKTAADRQRASSWAARGYVKDIWTGAVDGEKLPALQGSLADYLAYGRGASKFSALLTGFAPEDNMAKKTTEQALEAAEIKPEQLEKAWRSWTRSAH
jgi:hypothetical protein